MKEQLKTNGLIIGLDLEEYSSQISYFRTADRSVVSVNSSDRTQLFKNDKPLSRYFGSEILNEADYAGLQKLIERLFKALKEETKTNLMKSICVVLHEFSKARADAVRKTLGNIGIPEDIIEIIGIEEAYAYYIYNQDPATYTPGSMLFDYNETGLFACYMTEVEHAGKTYIAEVPSSLEDEAILHCLEMHRPLATIQEPLTQFITKALKGRNAASCFITGIGFDTEIPPAIINLLTAGRKGYAGQNLYVKGAAYAAADRIEQKLFKGKIPAFRNRITTGISMVSDFKDEKKEIMLVSPGGSWYTADKEVDVIVSGTHTLNLKVTPPMGQRAYAVSFSLSGFDVRPDKTTRLGICFAFQSDDRCMITVRDLGFGTFTEAGNHVVSKEIDFKNPEETAITPVNSGWVYYCRYRRCENPYLIGNTGRAIFSIEELMYYIYHNIYLIDKDFVCDSLITFLRDGCGAITLADRLVDLMNRRASLSEMLVVILKSGYYYTDEEIDQLTDLLGTLTTSNVFERMNAVAEGYIRNECYSSAITNLKRIINAQRDFSLPVSFYGTVYHNLGVAYARLFLYEEAAECFKEAYSLNDNPDSRRMYLAADLLKKGDHFVSSEHPSEEEYVLRRELATLRENARYSENYRKLEKIEQEKDHSSPVDYYSKIDASLTRLKKDYLKYTS